jgi:murein L,D-transpeptidase YafK
MGAIIGVVVLIASGVAHAGEKADKVLVKKSAAKLYLLKNGEVFAEYRAAFGPNYRHKKMADGDERTPEGLYRLDYKNADSLFYKSIHISYPNADDLARAERLGVDPGGNIAIHGQPQRPDWSPELAQHFNWTDGCIALTDADMDEIWAAVEAGTPIEILP